jgi:hypothetical protein
MECSMMSQENAWLNGRELLISEIEIRVEAMRSEAEKTRGFRAGLLVFLERRLTRAKSALTTLRHLPSALSEGRRQTVDRMVSAIIGTLRHAEITLRGESGTPPEPDREFLRERRQGERRQSPSRRSGKRPEPAGQDEEPARPPEPDRDRDVGDGS